MIPWVSWGSDLGYGDGQAGRCMGGDVVIMCDGGGEKCMCVLPGLVRLDFGLGEGLSNISL